MPFEFAFLDWLYQFRNPVMNTISIFFDYATSLVGVPAMVTVFVRPAISG